MLLICSWVRARARARLRYPPGWTRKARARGPRRKRRGCGKARAEERVGRLMRRATDDGLVSKASKMPRESFRAAIATIPPRTPPTCNLEVPA